MDRSRFGRAMAILAIAALAVAVVSPAFSATTLTKAKVKKIARKQINKLVPGMIDAATIDQGTIPAVTASITDPNKTVFTTGPFTVSLDCSDDAGNVNIQLLVKTSEENSILDSGFDYGEFDPADGDQTIHDFTGNPPGGGAGVYGGASYYAQATLYSPSGTKVYLEFEPITNFKGNHCYAEGWFLNLA
jgi:hypothetical protein